MSKLDEDSKLLGTYNILMIRTPYPYLMAPEFDQSPPLRRCPRRLLEEQVKVQEQEEEQVQEQVQEQEQD